MEIQFSKRIEILQLTKMLVDKIKPIGFIEIGSQYGHDANFIGNFWDIPTYVIEPHPDLAELIRQTYPDMNLYEFAAFNKDGEAKFNAFKVNVPSPNIPVSEASSLLEPIYTKCLKDVVTVSTKRMDTFLAENNISADIAKIDAEGVGYEVLEGFGDRLKDMKAIQIEVERKEMFKGQKILDSILELMSKDFVVHDTKQKNRPDQWEYLFLNKSIV